MIAELNSKMFIATDSMIYFSRLFLRLFLQLLGIGYSRLLSFHLLRSFRSTSYFRITRHYMLRQTSFLAFHLPLGYLFTRPTAGMGESLVKEDIRRWLQVMYGRRFRKSFPRNSLKQAHHLVYLKRALEMYKWRYWIQDIFEILIA